MISASLAAALRLLAVMAGLAAIGLPLASVLLSSRPSLRRTVGTGRALRAGLGALAVTIALVALGALLWRPIPLAFTAHWEGFLLGLGSLLYFPAIALYLWGFAALGRHFAVSTSGGAEIHTGHRLVRRGPYRYIRHPMYLAVLLAAPGALLIFRTWAMLLFLPLSLVVLRRARQEETLLAAEYGEAWRAYAREVPGWLPRR